MSLDKKISMEITDMPGKQNIYSISQSIDGRFMAIAGLENIDIYHCHGEKIIEYPNEHGSDIIMLEFHGDPMYCCSSDAYVIKIANLNSCDWEAELKNEAVDEETNVVLPWKNVDLSYCGKYILSSTESR